MPIKPSPQVRPIYNKRLITERLWQKFLEHEQGKKVVNRPEYSDTYATCIVCGSRALLPRQYGNICSRCKKQKEQEVKIDVETQRFLRKHPRYRRRFQY